MSLDVLRDRCGREWRAIGRARAEADARLKALAESLAHGGGAGRVDSEDISVVVFGSLARGEFTPGSDLDWTVLIDGQADHQHVLTARRVEHLARKAGMASPGPTGVFGNLAFSHNIIHQIGGEDDSNRNTTRRLLLLLESRSLGRPEAHDRVMHGILSRYLENDERAFKYEVPRFLYNDIDRYWRTMCVDYADKARDRGNEGWALRHTKLRMSRKLVFVSGMLMCLSCHPDLLAEAGVDLPRPPSAEVVLAYLRDWTRRTPLESLADALARFARPETAAETLDAYDDFLALMNAPDVRDRLKKLDARAGDADPFYQGVLATGRRFQGGLKRLLFRDSPRLAELVHEYGVL